MKLEGRRITEYRDFRLNKSNRELISIIYEIKTLDKFREVKHGKVGFITIVDKNNQEDDKIHYPHCYTVTEEGFRKKVIDNDNYTGNYFYSHTVEEAKSEIGARPCKVCKPKDTL